MKAFVRQKSIRQATLHWHTKENSVKNFFSPKGILLKIFKFFTMKFIWTIVIVFSLIYWCIFLFKHTLFVPDYVIKKIQYDSWSLQKFDDPFLYKAIGKYLKGENYHVARRSKWFILDGVQATFPIVSNITIEYVSPNTFHVTIDFFTPEMVIKNQSVLFGVYWNYTFRIYSWNTIGSGQEMLYLPMYASGLTTIEWLFYKQTAKELQEQMSTIYSAFPKSKFVAYLPGAERTVIMTVDGKKLFLNNLVELWQQIKNYELLRRYYTDFAKLKEIDLGSLEKDKVIVKK